MKMYAVMRGQFGSSDSAETVFVFGEDQLTSALVLCQEYEDSLGAAYLYGDRSAKLTERQHDHCFYDKDTEVYYEWCLVPVIL